MPRGAANEQLARARGCSADGQPVGEGRACESWDKPNGVSHPCPGAPCVRALCALTPQRGPEGRTRDGRQ
eukprot:6106936-Alexandrium_andersonii.AAC.1